MKTIDYQWHYRDTICETVAEHDAACDEMVKSGWQMDRQAVGDGVYRTTWVRKVEIWPAPGKSRIFPVERYEKAAAETEPVANVDTAPVKGCKCAVCEEEKSVPSAADVTENTDTATAHWQQRFYALLNSYYEARTIFHVRSTPENCDRCYLRRAELINHAKSYPQTAPEEREFYATEVTYRGYHVNSVPNGYEVIRRLELDGKKVNLFRRIDGAK